MKHLKHVKALGLLGVFLAVGTCTLKPKPMGEHPDYAALFLAHFEGYTLRKNRIRA